jgi:hypothetical protein
MPNHVNNPDKKSDSPTIWTQLRLYAPTLFLASLARHFTKPSIVMAIPLGTFGSEGAAMWLVLQFINLWKLNESNPELFRNWLGKIVLLVNGISSAIISRNCVQALGARATFQRELIAQAGIQPKSNVEGIWGIPLMSLIPMIAISRGGKHVKIRRNIPFADLKQIDPKISQRWLQSTAHAKNRYMYAFRGRISQWLSLDILRCGEINSNSPAPICMYIHGGGFTLGVSLMGRIRILEN